MLGGRPVPGGGQQRTELVTVQGGGVGLIIKAGPPDVRSGCVIEEFFLDGVPVEPGDCAQPPRDGGPGAAASFQIPGEALNVGAAGLQ